MVALFLLIKIVHGITNIFYEEEGLSASEHCAQNLPVGFLELVRERGRDKICGRCLLVMK